MCARMRGRKWTRSQMLFRGGEDLDGLSDGIGGESDEDGKAARRALAHSSLVM